MRKANETLVYQNERLLEQCKSLTLRKESVEAKLARQNECFAMQTEDAKAEQLRLRHQKTRELNQVCRRYKKQVSDIISSMTLLVDAKSTEIVQLTSRLHNEILEHTTDRENLEAENMRMATKLMLYQQQYSVANADWNAKEEELKSCMNEAERLCSQYKQQKLALRSTIKTQFQSNARLVAKNKAMKADALKLREMIAMLEVTTTRLESKVAYWRENDLTFLLKMRKSAIRRTERRCKYRT